MKKHLLIFTWEYNGYHSKQGTALAKRPRQVAESFNTNGWEVTVIYKDHRNECEGRPFVVIDDANGIKRIPVTLTGKIDHSKNQFRRKLETLYYIRFYGDRTSIWAKDVICNFNSFALNRKPDLILSFFTPRAPLYLGNYFGKKLNVPWIADLQDPIFEGITKKSKPFSRRWMANVLRSAKAVVHVCPEWAEMDGNLVNRKIETIRHAIPKKIDVDSPKYHSASIDVDRKAFNVFYGGYISPDTQSVATLKSVITSFSSPDTEIQLLLAGDDVAYNYLKQNLGDKAVRYLGWLTTEVMIQYILNCDCTLVVPWSKDRMGIPSKFYEYCSYGKPIWIIGDDLGSFTTLLLEWKHPEIKFGDNVYQRNALEAAVKGSYDNMFSLENCKGYYVREADLFSEYMKYA